MSFAVNGGCPGREEPPPQWTGEELFNFVGFATPQRHYALNRFSEAQTVLMPKWAPFTTLPLDPFPSVLGLSKRERNNALREQSLLLHEELRFSYFEIGLLEGHCAGTHDEIKDRVAKRLDRARRRLGFGPGAT
jgi:hypothetical protein